MDPSLLKWARVALVFSLILFLCIGAAKFLAQDNPSLFTFIPASVILVVLIVFELITHFMAILHHYEISTAVALIVGFFSLLLLLIAALDKDQERRTIVAGFGGSLLGFATGIPFGQLKANKPPSGGGGRGGRTTPSAPTPPATTGS